MPTTPESPDAMEAFVHTSRQARIIFGRGTVSRVGDEVRRLGATNALIVCTPEQRSMGDQLAGDLGSLTIGVFDEAAMHTPVAVTDRAIDVVRSKDADCVVAVGGGSTTGLTKAIAARTDLPQVVVPTTYAGSEVTPILGETKDGLKTTRRGPEILPEVVIYDPSLTQSLPLKLSVTSGLNAIAHAAEGLYAADRTPIYSLMAVEGVRAMRDGLVLLTADPQDTAGRDRALYAAWLCGTVLGNVGMSVHHKLCHTLGGALDLPHAETHAVLLPHTIAFVEEAVPELLSPVAETFGSSAGRGLFDFAESLGAPARLADLGVTEDQLDDLADQAAANPYWSPRPLNRPAIHTLLVNAWMGQRPA